MQPHFSLRKWTRLAVSACLLAGAGLAQAQSMAPAPSPPAGWVWQGVWQDGRWTGQWVPGAPGGPGRPGRPGPVPQGAYAPMPYAPMPYGGPSYGPMPMAPMGWMMVPVVQGPQAPCVETRTVTTEYVTERRHRVIRAHPHRKEKRVYTGS